MTPRKALVVAPLVDGADEAIELTQQQNGHGLARWQCVELICQEWLGAFGAFEPPFEEPLCEEPLCE